MQATAIGCTCLQLLIKFDYMLLLSNMSVGVPLSFFDKFPVTKVLHIQYIQKQLLALETRRSYLVV